VVVQLRERLAAEAAERDAEAAAFSAALLESDRQLSDW
jgi:hypothetical protein